MMNANGYYSAYNDEFIKREGIIVRLRTFVEGELKQTEWYQYEPINFDLVKDFDNVKTVCDDNLFCLLDAYHWSIMNKSELTASIYKYIAHRVHVIKDGFAREAEHLSNVDVLDNFLTSIGM
jgi:hypothetical protein